MYKVTNLSLLAILAAVIFICYPAAVQAGAPPPNNDHCADAVPISNECITFDITNADTDGPSSDVGPPEGCFVSSDPQINMDVWYIYTATCTGDVTVSTCGSPTNFDTKLAVYEATTSECSDLGDSYILACNDDDSCGDQAQVTVPVVSGQQYLVRVGKFDDSANNGPGTLCITPESNCSGCDQYSGTTGKICTKYCETLQCDEQIPRHDVLRRYLCKYYGYKFEKRTGTEPPCEGLLPCGDTYPTCDGACPTGEECQSDAGTCICAEPL